MERTEPVPATPARESPPRPARPPHLWQVDVLRLAPMLGMIAVHVLLFTAPASSRWSGAAVIVLHVSREIFFFISAFVLTYALSADRYAFRVPAFWRRRYPIVAAPYLAWTLLYWALLTVLGWPRHVDVRGLGVDLLTGWFHLYFLLVTMQLYALYPLLAWLVRRLRRHPLALLGASAAVQLGLTALIQYRQDLIPSGVLGFLLYAPIELTSYQFYFVAGAVAATHLDACVLFVRRHWRGLRQTLVFVLLGAEACYLVNLHLGQPPPQASGVFQPVVLPLVLAALTGIWMLAERLRGWFPPRSVAWRRIKVAADHSFAVFLAHAVLLIAVLQPRVDRMLGLGDLPWPPLAAVRFVLVLTGAALLVALLRWTPLSWVLTGRPSRLRLGRLRPGSPA
ncbi:MAG TPA: acyltransferase [Candidatus Binatia bacterium]|nr:acyltransferase [Candidatus Binatia bacterium]